MEIFNSIFYKKIVDELEYFLYDYSFLNSLNEIKNKSYLQFSNFKEFNDFYKYLRNELNYVKENNINSEEFKFYNPTKLYKDSLELLNEIKEEFNIYVMKYYYPEKTEEDFIKYEKILISEIEYISEILETLNFIYKKINENIKDKIDIPIDNNNDKLINEISSWENSIELNYYKETSNNLMSEWTAFLESLLDKPNQNFIINKNTVTNFDIIFRNPQTKLNNKKQKEPIVHLSYNSSRRSEPVFSIGNTTFNSKAYGPKLTSGTLVVTAYDNVPLRTLHAISNSTSYSVEDLPPLDLFIIPKTILYDGRFEVLVIRGINFINTQQNNNASSTGIYHSFQFFAKSVEPAHYSSVKDFIES